ncbi:MAG: BTAD domain-containing putative transcriptional regulator [Hespellia sp.]|nr:BTAD domain-containing putative transcriptional regulator [Hespellia sp.]
MGEKSQVLKVYFFGRFTITYGDKPISFGKNNTTKAMKLLQLLLYFGNNGIARERILEALYGREELADVANNLRVTVYRLKKMLSDAGLPQNDYITIRKGIYQWNAPMETEVDTNLFETLVNESETEKDEEKKINLLKQACGIYSGDFLSDLSGEDWVLVEAVHYKNQYTQILKEVCKWQMEHGQYEETLQVCKPACELYPFDEWQTVRIECFIALKKYKEAMKEYECTAKLFFEELGINPSEKMMEQFQLMSSHMNFKPQELRNIKSNLKETEDRLGAYYCNLPSFRDNYRLMARLMERNGQSAFLMMCSLTNGKGQPLENGEKLELLSGELNNTIKNCLRRGDSYTKYSASQFLALLTGIDKESCQIIYNRITKYFCRDHKTWSQYLEFYVSSIADVEREDSKIQFDDKDTIW